MPTSSAVNGRPRFRFCGTLVVQIPYSLPMYHGFVSFFDFLAFVETGELDPPVG